MIIWFITILMLTTWELYNMRKKDLRKEKVILVFLSLLSIIMAYLNSKYPYNISIAGLILDLFGFPH